MVSIATPASDKLWRQIFDIIREVGKRNPWPLIALILVVVIGNSRTAFFVLALGGITQALIDQNRAQAIIWALVFIGSGLIEQIYWPLKNHLRSMVEDDAAVLLQTRVMRNAAIAPLELYEDATFFNTLTRANDDLGRRATLVLAQALDILQVVILFGGLLAPLWFIDPRLVVFVLIGCSPIFITTWKTATAFHEAKTINAPGERYASRLADLILLRESAAELRLFGTGPEIVNRWLSARFRIASDSTRAVGRVSKSQFTGEVFAAIGLASALVLLVGKFLLGQADLGSLVAVVFAISFSVSLMGSLAEGIRLVRENGAFLGDIFAFEQSASGFSSAAPVEFTAAHGPMSVSLHNVSFHYPNSEHDVVRNVNLEFTAGEHIALLGENGAGKSTLVRLIAGLYSPSEGEVLHNESLVKGASDDVGAVFQDFVRWQLPLRDNIGFGNLRRQSDDALILDALARADLASLPGELDDGLDSWLGREFGDRDLSGGQWQKLAIARAFFRNARLLILDEPTATLDPLAEQRLFERFRHLAADKTTLTISHRIGSARAADRILVMENGTIIEDGTHESLMQLGGTYSSMFRSQQEWYKRDIMA